MTLKALAHSAHTLLQARAGSSFPRSHVYELIAATLGYKSWAAFNSDALLADAGLTAFPETALTDCFGRAYQLGYPSALAEAIAMDVIEFAKGKHLCVVRWTDLQPFLLMPHSAEHLEDEFDDDEDEAWSDETDHPAAESQTLTQEALLSSPLLIDSLTTACSKESKALFALAAIHRCKKPNSYLYEESLKGRVLNAAEQGWADNYLVQKPRHKLYKEYLRSAAESGVRQAALEYGIVFEQREFIALAERLEGDVDTLQMAHASTTEQAKNFWLRKAAEEGSLRALETLAYQGDAWAEDRFVKYADSYWLRRFAERALENGDTLRAWTWQYVALRDHCDLTHSTLRARHSEGSNAGQLYDDDVGGPMYVDGDEGLELPELTTEQHSEAKSIARNILKA